MVFAVTEPKAGKKGISAFLVPTDRPGFIVDKVERKLGQGASDTCALRFTDLFLENDLMLGQPGDGYRIALSNLEAGRIGIAAQSVGMAQAALEIAVAYAKQSTSMGKPIIQHQAVGFRLADMAARLEAARQLVLHVACIKDADEPCLKEASMAKLVASETAEMVCWARSRPSVATATWRSSASPRSTAMCGSARSTKALRTFSGWSSPAHCEEPHVSEFRSSSSPTPARRWAASRARSPAPQGDRAGRGGGEGAVERAGVAPERDRADPHGLRPARRPRPGAGAAGGAGRGPAEVGGGDHRQQDVRLGHAGGDHGARRAGRRLAPTIVVAGGMESMTNAPYLLAKHRGGARIGHDRVMDSHVPRRPGGRLRAAAS